MNSPLRIAVVSASQAPSSRSRIAARRCVEALGALGAEADWIDLAAVALPVYPQGEGEPTLVDAMARFNAAHAWVVATPIYNFGPSGTLLTFLHYALVADEGERWRPFVVLASLAGLRRAMATDSLARTLIHERTSVQVGPPILCTSADVDKATGEVADHCERRIDEHMRALVRLARA